MEIQADNQQEIEQTSPDPNDVLFTVERHTFNYILIAFLFFALGGLIGALVHSRNIANNETLIQTAVDAAFTRQEETISRLIEVGELTGSESPSAVSQIDDDPSLGPENAPVVIVEFSDFNCSFCKRFHDTTLNSLLEQYEGQIRFVYRDFAILGETSVTSAMAAECAYDQGKFWEYHDLLFANQGRFDRASLIGYAQDLELDTTQFTTCLDDQTHLEDVRADSQAAQEIGARGTPAFLINDQFVSGAQPVDVFTQIIDAELAKKTE